MKINKSNTLPNTINHRLSASSGFTVVETMIFLAVSGVMFVMAAAFINGKQDSVAFRQGMQAAASSINSVINSVANGEYSSLPSDVKCTADNLGSPPTFAANPSDNTAQGTGQGCMFLGKSLQFGQPSDTQYKIYSVVSRQFVAGSLDPVQSFAEAKPVKADTPLIDLTQTDSLERGLTFDKALMCPPPSVPGSCNPIDGVGFYGSFGNYSGEANNDGSSGAQSVTTVVMQPGNQIDDLAQEGDPGKPSILDQGHTVVLCFSRGDKIGSVTIGGENGQTTSISIQYLDDAASRCPGP